MKRRQEKQGRKETWDADQDADDGSDEVAQAPTSVTADDLKNRPIRMPVSRLKKASGALASPVAAVAANPFAALSSSAHASPNDVTTETVETKTASAARSNPFATFQFGTQQPGVPSGFPPAPTPPPKLPSVQSSTTTTTASPFSFSAQTTTTPVAPSFGGTPLPVTNAAKSPQPAQEQPKPFAFQPMQFAKPLNTANNASTLNAPSSVTSSNNNNNALLSAYVAEMAGLNHSLYTLLQTQLAQHLPKDASSSLRITEARVAVALTRDFSEACQKYTVLAKEIQGKHKEAILVLEKAAPSTVAAKEPLKQVSTDGKKHSESPKVAAPAAVPMSFTFGQQQPVAGNENEPPKKVEVEVEKKPASSEFQFSVPASGFSFAPPAKVQEEESIKVESENSEGDDSSGESEAAGSDTEKQPEKEETKAAAPVAPSSFTFGSTDTSVAKLPSFGAQPLDSGATSKPFSFTFGAPSTATTTNADGSAAATLPSFGTTSMSASNGSTPTLPSFGATSAFTFGGAAAASSTPVFSFGAGAAVTPTPVSNGDDSSKPAAFSSGFSFNPVASSFQPGGTTSGFSFSVPSVLGSSSKGDAAGGEEEEDAAAAGEEFQNQRTKEQEELVKRGAGEEDEITRHEVRCKVYRLNDDGQLKDLGINFLKVNQAKDELAQQRLLARQDGTGTITLNCKVSAVVGSQLVGAAKKDLSLLIVEQVQADSGAAETKPVRYTVRCKDATFADGLKKAVDTAMEEVKK